MSHSRCYIAEFSKWCQTIPAYNINYQNVEELHYFISKLDADNNDLSVIVNIIRLYSGLEAEIKAAIHDYFMSNGHKCTHCMQSMSVEVMKKINYKPTLPINKINYMPAITYLTGLTEIQYNDLKKLKNCEKELMDIYNMIGMDDIKSEFCKVLKYLISQKSRDTMMHIGIYGPPGHGKTKIAQLLAKAFIKSGLLSKDVFIKASRSDLIGKYCGHTAKATTETFDKARGGVIFIDEIYSLGNKEHSDVFTGECINTINQLLSERTDTLCIIAGYHEEAEQCFFSYNPGLRSRFPFNFNIKKYTPDDLCAIFTKMAQESGWTVAPDAIKSDDLKTYMDSSKLNNGGRDMEHILTKAIMAHSQHNFLKTTSNILSRKDVQSGLKNYFAHKKDESGSAPSEPPIGMYS